MLLDSKKDGNMLQIFENAVSEEDLLYIRKEFDQLKETVQFDSQLYYLDDQETIKEIYHSDKNQLVQQERLKINHYALGKKLQEIFRPYITDYAQENNYPIWACRAHLPIGLHTDTDDHSLTGYTVILPLTFNDSIKTIVWKPLLGKAHLDKLIQDFIQDPFKFPRKCSISRELDLEHCWMSKPTLTDAIELDGYVAWKKGTIVKFDRRQPHAGTNWKTDSLPYKDYILIHADQ